MQQTFTLRKFTPDDLQAVMRINRVCLPENYTDMFFMDLHQRFPETFIVAEEDGEIIGYIMCRIEVGLSNIGLGGLVRKGHVVSIAVMPKGRRKGVATALLKAAMEGMTRYKAKQIFLEVRVTNHAGIELYKKLGLEVSRTISGYYSDGEDAYVMTKRL
ncbi:MAG: ribosomal protein S18-alanine N-acetyltransferase [Candidatus Bathyarchaeota archaeon]|nr:ribosomal protein S18-alanine N-acetyltransferase [Candidatus Bathyarchaeota archaeon]